jgi:phenylpropionate dioxygenase-like ring-hydroxylating dioxygenase large terminal subunit
MWLRNCWHVISWDHGIALARSSIFVSRMVLGEPVPVCRTDSGLVAMADRCGHRLAPQAMASAPHGRT